jgi:hypothetical protein
VHEIRHKAGRGLEPALGTVGKAGSLIIDIGDVKRAIEVQVFELAMQGVPEMLLGKGVGQDGSPSLHHQNGSNDPGHGQGRSAMSVPFHHRAFLPHQALSVKTNSIGSDANDSSFRQVRHSSGLPRMIITYFPVRKYLF